VLFARIALKQVNERIGQIVNVHELAARPARPPQLDFHAALDLCPVRLGYQRSHDVARNRIEIVVGSIEIGRHGRDEIASVLPPVGLARLDSGDLGDRVPLICGLERPAQKGILANRLHSEARINAR